MKSTVTLDVDTLRHLSELAEFDRYEELERALRALVEHADGDRRGLEVRLPWTGSSASAALIVDEVDRADIDEAHGGRYASADSERGYYQEDLGRLVVDTVSGRYTMRPGDVLVSTPDGGWLVEPGPKSNEVTVSWP